MGKKLIITEKPSVARDFARVFGVGRKHQGYIDNDEYVITWCVGHLVKMVYPEEYDIKYKKWRLEDLPFLPENYKYDVIKDVKDQYRLVNGFLNSKDIDVVYWAGDSGKEGQTIEENIRNFGGVRRGMKELRVWIDSQTDDEIRRGIAEAKPMSDYANLGKSGIMRAIEDYALGINFSRALSVKYGTMINKAAATRSYTAIAVGRVMTCVLGMVVNREREIRNFTETPFYRVIAGFAGDEAAVSGDTEKAPGPEKHARGGIEAEWHVNERSLYYNSPVLYKDNGFKEEKDADALIKSLADAYGTVESVEKNRSKKKAPFLFNLAELQAECSKLFKLSPDETLNVAQILYERKMTTYPRSDARVLTTAVAKEISRNISGLRSFDAVAPAAEKILADGSYKNIAKSQYTDDSKVTDHYAIIPTGVFNGYSGLNDIQKKVYELIVRRFLSIFYPPAEYLQIKLTVRIKDETFNASAKVLVSPGYLEVAGGNKNGNEGGARNGAGGSNKTDVKNEADVGDDTNADMVKKSVLEALSKMKKGSVIRPSGYEIKEGKTSPPKRYTSGTMILAMENAGSLIEDEELRAQIKNTGIGTSATRAEIIKKLVRTGYIDLNKKTQVLTPGKIGEMIYEAVKLTEPSLLDPRMSASWEKGLDEITNGRVDVKVYRGKLENYIRKGTLNIAQRDRSAELTRAISCMYVKQTDPGKPDKPQEKRKYRIQDIICPICGGRIKRTENGFACENHVSGISAPQTAAGEGAARAAGKDGIGSGSCIFSVGRVLGRTLTEEEVCELITSGSTPVLRGLVTAKGEKFDARIGFKRSEDGRITGMRVVR